MLDKVKAVSIDPNAGGVGVTIDEQGIHIDVAKLVAKTVVAGTDEVIVYDSVGGVRKISRDTLIGDTGAVIIKGSVILTEGGTGGTLSDGSTIERAVAPPGGDGTAYVVSNQVAANAIAGTSDTDFDNYEPNNLVMWYAPDWQTVKAQTGTVKSVFGRVGDVAAETGDYSASQITTTTTNSNIQEDIDALVLSDNNQTQAINSNTQTNASQQTSIDALLDTSELTGEPV